MNANISRDSHGNYDVTTAAKVGGYRKPRTHQRFSPVLVTRADGSQSVITKERKSNGRTRTHTVVDIPHKTTAADLPAIFAD